MPLISGSSQEKISHNIKEMLDSSSFHPDKPQEKRRQIAIAAAEENARRTVKSKEEEVAQKKEQEEDKDLKNFEGIQFKKDDFPKMIRECAEGKKDPFKEEGKCSGPQEEGVEGTEKSMLSKSVDQILEKLERSVLPTLVPQSVIRNKELIEKYHEYLERETKKIFVGDSKEISLKNGLKVIIFKASHDLFTGAILSEQRHVPLATFEDIDLSCLVIELSEKGFITERSFYSNLDDEEKIMDTKVEKAFPKKEEKVADKKSHKYPFDTEDQVREAISHFAATANHEKYEESERKSIARRIMTAARKHGIEVSQHWKDKFGLEKSASDFLDSCFELLEKGDSSTADKLCKTFMGFDSIKYTPSDRNDAIPVVVKPQSEAFDTVGVDNGKIEVGEVGANDFGLTEKQKETIKMIQHEVHKGARVSDIDNVYDGTYDVVFHKDGVDHKYNLDKNGLCVKLGEKKSISKLGEKMQSNKEFFGKNEQITKSIYDNWGESKFDKSIVKQLGHDVPSRGSAFDRDENLGKFRMDFSEFTLNKAGSGPGSRGGKVVGTYADGTPAYAGQQYQAQGSGKKKRPSGGAKVTPEAPEQSFPAGNAPKKQAESSSSPKGSGKPDPSKQTQAQKFQIGDKIELPEGIFTIDEVLNGYVISDKSGKKFFAPQNVVAGAKKVKGDKDADK